MSLSNTHILVAPDMRNTSKKISIKSLLNNKNKSILSIHSINKCKETPLCISCQGSYTGEAAVVLPILLCVSIFAIFFMRILCVQIGVQRALDETGQQVASVWIHQDDLSVPQLALVCNAKMKKEKVPLSYVKGGGLGISYHQSSVEGNRILLIASYTIEFPIKIFGKMDWKISQKSVHRKWVGWDPKEAEDSDYVYVTPYGEAYHLRYNCNYLQPEIRGVEKRDVDKLRNHDGKKYKACKGCGAKKKKDGVVFLTEYGEVYHCSLGCVGLKRTIYRKHLKDVSGLHRCGKCGG